MQQLGIEVRAGLHAGECELVDRKVARIAVGQGCVASHSTRLSELGRSPPPPRRTPL